MRVVVVVVGTVVVRWVGRRERGGEQARGEGGTAVEAAPNGGAWLVEVKVRGEDEGEGAREVETTEIKKLGSCLGGFGAPFSSL